MDNQRPGLTPAWYDHYSQRDKAANDGRAFHRNLFMPTNYTELYFPVLLQVVIAVVLAGGLVGASAVLGQRIKNRVKDSPYESGMVPIGSARERFSVKFYLVGMVFILFDIEAIFLYPWAVVYRELNREMQLFGFIEMFLFIVLVLAGFFYIWKKGVLNWAVEEPEGKTRPVPTSVSNSEESVLAGPVETGTK
jgi:NADH-quinone oxidoreductase subunit A